MDWLSRLGAIARSPFGFALQFEHLNVVGTSPELCLSVSRAGRVITRPIKGTSPRGRTPQEDLQNIVTLQHNAKEIAELSMVIDLERNDLGRVAEFGSVSVLDSGIVETYGPVHQRVGTVSAVLRPDIDRTTLFRTFLPSGSVTGAPKVRAMEIIAALEEHRRGLYAGAYGFIGHDGCMRLAMAIRTLVSDADRGGHYFTGGGIVADSKPQLEVEETHWKALQLLDSKRFAMTLPYPPVMSDKCESWSAYLSWSET